MTKWAYILIGDNNTGKTIFQKEIIENITNSAYERLDCNQFFEISIIIGNGNAQNISFMNRSFQEKQSEYRSLADFFNSNFRNADIAILASHLCKQEISEMIFELKKRFFNVGGVFFENSITKSCNENSDIALLDWNQKYLIKNPKTDDEKEFKIMLKKSALEFTNQILFKN